MHPFFIRLFVIITAIPIFCFQFCGSNDVEARVKSVVLEAGGSNYVAFDLKPDRLSSSDAWKDSSIFQNPACMKDPERSTNYLSELRRNGQRKIAIMLWHAHLSEKSACSGYLINSSPDEFNAVFQSIRGLVETVISLGFDEIQVRFAPQWVNDPKSWSEWDSQLFQENEDFISNVSKGLSDLSNSIRIEVDLGVELGGLEGSDCVRRYVKTLWTFRMQMLRNLRSYGFSIAYGKGRLPRYLNWLSEVGELPDEIAVDIYKDVDKGLVDMRNEAQALGVSHPVFLIQETFYDDVNIKNEIFNAVKGGVNVRTVMQWPLKSGSRSPISEGETLSYIYSRNIH